MKCLMKFILLSIMLLSLISCESGENEVLTDSCFLAEIDERYQLTDEYSFIITDINDSRCPEGAQCFWQGVATVFIEFRMGRKIDTTLNTLDNRHLILGSYSISLGEIGPYPHIHDFPEKDEYRIELFVEPV